MVRLEDRLKCFSRRKPMANEEKKEIPGIYDVAESESYKKPGIDKELARDILLTYGSTEHVKAYEEISGVKLTKDE